MALPSGFVAVCLCRSHWWPWRGSLMPCHGVEVSGCVDSGGCAVNPPPSVPGQWPDVPGTSMKGRGVSARSFRRCGRSSRFRGGVALHVAPSSSIRAMCRGLRLIIRGGVLAPPLPDIVPRLWPEVSRMPMKGAGRSAGHSGGGGRSYRFRGGVVLHVAPSSIRAGAACGLRVALLVDAVAVYSAGRIRGRGVAP